MKKVTLKFKKKDFDSEYSNSKDCAITRALARAGHSNLEDAGTEIQNEKCNDVTGDTKLYRKMVDKVQSVYEYSGGKNFQATIELDI